MAADNRDVEFSGSDMWLVREADNKRKYVRFEPPAAFEQALAHIGWTKDEYEACFLAWLDCRGLEKPKEPIEQGLFGRNDPRGAYGAPSWLSFRAGWAARSQWETRA